MKRKKQFRHKIFCMISLQLVEITSTNKSFSLCCLFDRTLISFLNIKHHKRLSPVCQGPSLMNRIDQNYPYFDAMHFCFCNVFFLDCYFLLFFRHVRTTQSLIISILNIFLLLLVSFFVRC